MIACYFVDCLLRLIDIYVCFVTEYRFCLDAIHVVHFRIVKLIEIFMDFFKLISLKIQILFVLGFSGHYFNL